MISSLAPGVVDKLIVRRGGNGLFPGLFDPFAKVAARYSALSCPSLWAVNSQQVICYEKPPGRAPPDVLVRQALEAVGERATEFRHPKPPAGWSPRER